LGRPVDHQRHRAEGTWHKRLSGPRAARHGKATDALSLIDHDIQLATAAFISARFPYLSPLAVIHTGCGTVRLVDGGYVENSGALTAQELLESLRAQPADPDLQPVCFPFEDRGRPACSNAVAATASASWCRWFS